MSIKKKIHKNDLEGTLFLNDLGNSNNYYSYNTVLKNIKVIEDLPKKVLNYCILNDGNLKSDELLKTFDSVKRIKRVSINLVLSVDFDYFPFAGKKKPTKFKQFFKSYLVNSGEIIKICNNDQLAELFGNSENKGRIIVNKEDIFKFFDLQGYLSASLKFINKNLCKTKLETILKFLRLYDFQKRIENENR